ncbi:Putative Dynein light chain roadblock-type [Rhizopus microsporus]|nr:Putative Dynein light chain roadblock-type [Rhizopus microsporus]
MTFDVDETLKRISSKKGVKAVVIVNAEGAAIRSTLDHELTKQYGQLIASLVQQAKTAVKTLDDQVSFYLLKNNKVAHVSLE